MQKLSKQQEKFNKVIEIYKKKYQLSLHSFRCFVDQKITATEQMKKTIIDQIERSKGKGKVAKITIEQLSNYLHLVAAAQANIEIRGKSIDSFKSYYRLSFKQNKSKESDKQIKSSKMNNNKKQVGSEANKIPSTIDQAKKEEQSFLPAPQPAKVSKRNNVSSPVKQRLQVIQQDVIDENRVSNRIDTTQQYLLKVPSANIMQISSDKLVRIVGYDKFGQNYLNPIIKYHIVYKEKNVYRRYSEFQKLMAILGRKYQGFILPELPPKEGLKSTFSYFRGVDEEFLNQRQLKLEQLLNNLLKSKYANRDQLLISFLSDQQLQLEDANQGGALEVLKSLTSIALNTQELKHYGLAYYNYLKQFSKAEVQSNVTRAYKQLQPTLQFCLSLEQHRNAINSNFQHRRQLFMQLNIDDHDRPFTITSFDNVSSTTASQIRNLSKEIEKYLQLKSQESWLSYLLKQKQQQRQEQELRKEHLEIINRIQTMERNLLASIQELKSEKQDYLIKAADLMIGWRKAIHP